MTCLFLHASYMYKRTAYMTLDMLLRKTCTGKKALSFLGLIICIELFPSTKNVRITAFFHTFSEETNFKQTLWENKVSLSLKQLF